MRAAFPLLIVLSVGIVGCEQPCAQQKADKSCNNDMTGGHVHLGPVPGSVNAIKIRADQVQVVSSTDPCNDTGCIETHAELYILDVTYTEPNGSAMEYRALIGPDTKVCLQSNGSLIICSAKGWVYVYADPAQPHISLDPWVQTSHVDAGGDGCRFAVEVYEGDVSHQPSSQVYLYDGGTHAKKKGSTGSANHNHLRGTFHRGDANGCTEENLNDNRFSREKYKCSEIEARGAALH